ncbi:MAG: ATP-binding protein [Bacteroidales bacterium]|jgi:predicted AAA+ superfamily ATPase|nr:ATP-binding protein [Bacteroidales bacterium]MDD2632582.1 ATP-binding protein [Bacteroidales bacterium]MDD3131254.1 ATP-binding protein [Bacteroidales bacterium]MDD4177427.1 ATP-binding protein [Bacteroidales bacterium]MDY0334809.1 ATP-binding protein [Bacteroidales bacterium]
MIKRHLESEIEKDFFKGKAIILLGARQVGKTTLMKEICKNKDEVLWLDADDPDTQLLFENPTSTRLRTIIGSHKILVVDEAQRIKDIGIKLKLISDQIKDVQLVATGSSSFELANQINEPLTGRKWEYQLYPISYSEMVSHHGLLEEMRMVPHRMVYGYYPEVVTNTGNEKRVLREIYNSYLYKDILKFDQIKKPEKVTKLLQALAFQIGNEVSYHELSKTVGIDNQTVEKYIDILEKAYIIFRLTAFSRNARKEIVKGRKIYFVDNGIRNAVIANFKLPELRQDIGALWENYLVSERFKFLKYNDIWANSYFWRTYDQQEIDYLEERDGKLFAYEFKWSSKQKARLPKTFSNAYPDNQFKVINQENFEEFIMKT